MNIIPEHKAQLVDALLACPSVNDPNTRNALINDLPSAIKDNFQRNHANRVEVVNLVNRCLDFRNGMEILIRAVRVFEGDSDPMRKVYDRVPPILGYESPVRLELLSELLFILARSTLPFEDLKSHYRASLPKFFKPLPGKPTCWPIIGHLANIPLQADRTLPILLFVRNIAGKLRPSEISGQLENWMDRVVSDLEPGLGKIEMTPKSGYREKEPEPIYLLVHLIPDPNNRNNKRQEFAVHIYAWRNPENVPRIYSNGKCEKREILDVIDDVIATKLDEDDEIHAIEFILPGDWLHLDVDEWKRADEFEWEPRLIRDYQVIVRVDRYHYAGKRLKPHFQKRWKKQWQRFSKMTDCDCVDSCVHWVCNHEGYDAKKEYREFDREDSPKACLIQTFLPRNHQDLALMILNAGIPVALWCKKFGHKAKDHDGIKNEILKLIKDGKLDRLPDRVHKIRRKPEREKRLQDHLTLLWDDPDRLPRDLKESHILKTP